VAIVGPTGVGKSTLAQLLVRLADPSEGTVRVEGVDVRDADPLELRQAAAIVFQESFLFAASVRDNIALDDTVDEAEVVRSAMIASADRFVRELPAGYDTVVGERGHTLSGGQRQRVALARALARQPRILILDDATSSVDPTIEANILHALRRELDTTLIVVAYRLSTIRLADRVIYLQNGKVAGTGSHDELLATIPGYSAIIRAYERDGHAEVSDERR
jgi:ABC-type multidrug transport system fused ATPase/permease subunit